MNAFFCGFLIGAIIRELGEGRFRWAAFGAVAFAINAYLWWAF